MPVVQKIVGNAAGRAHAIIASLDGLTNQEIADAILFAMVLHIAASVADDSQAEAAAGVGAALVKNFET